MAVESFLLAALGGIAGFALSVLGVRLLAKALEDIAKPYWIHFTMDGRVFLFFAAVCVLAAIAFGLAPALHLSKSNLGSLKSTAAVGARRWTKALLAVELALTLTLLAGAALLLRSFWTLYRLDNALDTTGLTAMALRLPQERYGSPPDWESFFHHLEERLAGIPAVASVTTASTFPFAGASTRSLVLEGDRGSLPQVSYLTIGPRYFETLGLRLLRDRDFNPIDGSEGHDAVIVSQLLAATFFPGESPLGRRIGLAASDAAAPSWFEIVGVAPDLRQRLVTRPDPTVYLPSRADPQPFAMLLVRGAPGIEAAVPVVREEVRALDPELPVYSIIEVERLRSQSRWPSRVFATLFGVFASIALGLSALGLHAVAAHGVSARVQEIGLRMAFGAEARQILWLVTRSIAPPLVAGVVAGLAGALGVGRLLETFLGRTNPSDPLMLLAISGLLVAASTVACWVPARRAMSLDPMTALRHE